MAEVRGKRVAVVGSGITGLSSAWMLHRAGARVTLFEREPVCGGHTLTDDSSGHAVDLGFQVYNLTTYPHLVGFLDALDVDTEPSDMSFALSLDEGKIEWSSVGDLDTVFAQRSNALSPAFLKMVADVVRFGREAPQVLLPENLARYRDVTLAQFLDAGGYSQAFRSQYVLPMCAAVWSVPQGQVGAFPVQMLVRFWRNHHLLDLTQRPKWRVVKGRSRSYVKAVLAELPDVRAGSAVVAVERVAAGGGVLVRYEAPAAAAAATAEASSGAGGVVKGLFSSSSSKQQKQAQSQGAAASPLVKEERFDAVVLATHSDVALRLLGQGATEAEREVLSAIPYGDNDVWLHTDASLMPRLRKTWASWNFLGRSAAAGVGNANGTATGNGNGNGTTTTTIDTNNNNDDPSQAAVCVTYWLNNLQRLGPNAPDLFCTLNPIHPPQASKTIRRLTLSHPIFSMASWRAQERLPSLQGQGGLYFAGAWAGYGFHEDGIRAAVDVCGRLGCGAPPWGLEPRVPSPKLSLGELGYLALFDRFARAAVRKGDLRIILPNGDERRYGDGDVAPARTDPTGAWRALPERKCVVRVFSAAMFGKIIHRHDVGMGEAYMDGDFEVDDLGGFLAIVVSNARELEGKRGVFADLGDALLNWAHSRRSNTREGSRKNIEEHYDAGNDMYALFLDETMTYSCGIHGPGVSLKDAQLAKLDAVIEAAGLTKEDHVLEIGCGWGSFAMRAAATRGCRVTGLTLSKEQLAEATKRVRAAGLEDRVRLLYCDYRDAVGPEAAAGAGGEAAANGHGNGSSSANGNTSTTTTTYYDAVVSIEMIEAVGHEHLESYFSAIGRLLKPGGKAVIQVIAQPDDRYTSYCRGSDFIREHIFPGGHLPSMGAMVDAARGTGLAVRAVRDIGPDYAVTLRAWREAWEARQEGALALGYSRRFWRKYNFYFAYCEAAFDARYIHDWHVTWVKSTEAEEEDGGLGGAAVEAVGVGGGAAASEEAGAAAKAAMRAQARAAKAAALRASRASSILPEDPWTQALLMLYAFLAGLLVSRHPLLWAMPGASAACALLYAASGGSADAVVAAAGLVAAAASALFWARIPGIASVARTLYATARYGVGESCAFAPPGHEDEAVASRGGVLSAAVARAFGSPAAAATIAAPSPSPPPPHESLFQNLATNSAAGMYAASALQPLPGAICAAAAGFFAFRLWLIVRQRRLAEAARARAGAAAAAPRPTATVPPPSLAAVARDALLLLAFGVAAVLPERGLGGRAFLAAALIGELGPAIAALRRLSSSSSSPLLRGAEALALLGASVLPRAALLAVASAALPYGGGGAAAAAAAEPLQHRLAVGLRAGLAVALAADVGRLGALAAGA